MEYVYEEDGGERERERRGVCVCGEGGKKGEKGGEGFLFFYGGWTIVFGGEKGTEEESDGVRCGVVKDYDDDVGGGHTDVRVCVCVLRVVCVCVEKGRKMGSAGACTWDGTAVGFGEEAALMQGSVGEAAKMLVMAHEALAATAACENAP